MYPKQIERTVSKRMIDCKVLRSIIGAGRGMGVDFAKAALTAGNAVVATWRNADTRTKAVGKAYD